MNTPAPIRHGSASPVMIAIVGIAGAVAGSLAVWTALAPGADVAATDHTCHCECVIESAPVPAASATPEGDALRLSAAGENGISTPPAKPTVPRVRQAEAEVDGPLDRKLIRRIVRAHISEVRYCYNQGLTTNPALSGRVAVQFTIGGKTGTVLESVVASSTLDEDESEEGVAACTANAVKRWKFPKFEGEAVVVTYPFVLTPGD